MPKVEANQLKNYKVITEKKHCLKGSEILIDKVFGPQPTNPFLFDDSSLSEMPILMLVVFYDNRRL